MTDGGILEARAFVLFESGVEIGAVAARLGVSRFAAYRQRAKWKQAKKSGTRDVEAAQCVALLLTHGAAELDYLDRMMLEDGQGPREKLRRLVLQEAQRRGW